MRAPAQTPQTPPGPTPAQTETVDQAPRSIEREVAPTTAKTATAKPPALRVTAERLSRNRVRLPTLRGARSSRVAVQVRTRQRVTVHLAVRWAFGIANPRFSVVVKRQSLALRWRMVLTSVNDAGTARRSTSRTVVLSRRTALRCAT